MKLLSLKTYGQAAERLTKHNPLTFKRAAFVSTEDPDVIQEVQNLTTFGVKGASELLVIFSSPDAFVCTPPLTNAQRLCTPAAPGFHMRCQCKATACEGPAAIASIATCRLLHSYCIRFAVKPAAGVTHVRREPTYLTIADGVCQL